MNEELLSVYDVFKIIRRHLLLIVLTLAVSEGVSLFLARTLPKKFKASALLNLKSSYFEIPGVGGGLSYSEIQPQKQAIMRLALEDGFIDRMGAKYELFKSAGGTGARESEREVLRNKIDFTTSSATTFRITAMGSTSAIAYGLASDTLDQIVEVLARERRNTLSLHRDSLVKQLESMGVASPLGISGESAKVQEEFLQREIPRAEKQLETLTEQYTADHPKSVEAKARLRDLRRQLERVKDAPSGGASSSGRLKIDPKNKDPNSEFGEELLKKIRYLDIALELERDKNDRLYFEVLERPVPPEGYVFPNQVAFAVGGILFGFFLAAAGLVILELRHTHLLTPLLVSRQLGVPLLGSMPRMIPQPPGETKDHAGSRAN